MISNTSEYGRVGTFFLALFIIIILILKHFLIKFKFSKLFEAVGEVGFQILKEEKYEKSFFGTLSDLNRQL